MYFLNELTPNPRRPWLGPNCQELEPPFRKIAKQIYKELYWVPTVSPEYMRDPQFLHEVLQRIVFNFLVEHAESGFMQLEKLFRHRKIEPTHTRNTELSIHHGSRFRVTAGMRRSRSMAEWLDTNIP